MFDAERSKQLGAYIGAINDGKPDAEAVKLLGVTSSLDIKLNNYGARKALPAITLPANELPIGEVTSRALSAGEAAVMPARMRSHNGVDQKQAQEVVAEARQLAAPYPNDAGAQNELAEAENDAGNYALSEAAADRALAADPKSVHALIYKGMAQMALADKAGNKDPAVWTKARRWFLTANRADPLYSYPAQLYYESFRTAKQAPTRAAKDGLLYAYKLSPQNIGLRYEVARVLLEDGQAKPARVAIEPIAYSEHGGQFAETAKNAIAALDSGGTAAALAVFDQAEAKNKEDAAKAKAKPADKKD
jgi:tetratricopeptide (TPR) repeat protein